MSRLLGLGEDVVLQLSELGAGFDADLLSEDATRVGEDPQRIGLTAGAVQRQRSLGPEAFVERRIDGGGLQIGQHGPPLAPAEPHVEPSLERHHSPRRET